MATIFKITAKKRLILPLKTSYTIIFQFMKLSQLIHFKGLKVRFFKKIKKPPLKSERRLVGF